MNIVENQVEVQIHPGFFFLNRQIVRSRSTARPAGFTEPSLVLQQQPIRTSVQGQKAIHVSAFWAVAVRVRRQVFSSVVSRVLPCGRVAVHLEEVGLFHCGSYFVLLCYHVLRILLAGQPVVWERER